MWTQAGELEVTFAIEAGLRFRCCVCKEPRQITRAGVAQPVLNERGVLDYLVIVCQECQLLAPSPGTGPADYVLSPEALRAEEERERSDW